MLHGRSIHFYYQFVEEPLALWLPQFVAAEVGTGCSESGRFSIEMMAKTSWPSVLSSSTKTEAPSHFVSLHDRRVTILGLEAKRTTIPDFETTFGAALKIIDSAHLAWMVDLGLGLVDLRQHSEWQLGVMRPMPRTLSDSVTLSHALIRATAKTFILLFALAECIVQNRFNRDDWHLLSNAWYVELFEDCIECEFACQAGFGPPGGQMLERCEAHSLIARLDADLSLLPLTKHLLCFWFPFWNQAEFLNGSPFDFANSLQSLYS